MSLYINKDLIHHLIAAAMDENNEDGSIWIDINGSSRRFEVNFIEFELDIVKITFKDTLEVVVETNEGAILNVSFPNPDTLDFNVSEIFKNLRHPDAKVVG